MVVIETKATITSLGGDRDGIGPGASTSPTGQCDLKEISSLSLTTGYTIRSTKHCFYGLPFHWDVVYLFVLETRSYYTQGCPEIHCVAQVGFQLRLLCLCLLSDGISGLCHHTWLGRMFSMEE